ncbi:MAG: ubiquinone/menaquinone biosynthesis methyltransferase [Dehalococcoidia bacterium]|nr:ubiquinone/menaquinone biosynthesis methyltransferase [Dehalococcoidia bacterium]
MSQPPASGPAKAAYVRALFGRIVGRYDLMNDLMTAGRHRAWRRWAVAIARADGALALDIGTGTGDFALELVRQGATRVVATDFVEPMVRAARGKTPAAGIIDVAVGDALKLPFADQTFDCLASGFLIRNVADAAAAFREMYRVLKPGGRIVCLETSRPRTLHGRALISGFGVGARVLGTLVAGDSKAYGYLPSSTARFADADELAELMEESGFSSVRYRSISLGLAAIHSGIK